MMSFYVEGPNWVQNVSVDSELLDNERDQLIEAGTLAIEKQVREAEELDLGAVLLVKRAKTSKKEEGLRKKIHDVTYHSISSSVYITKWSRDVRQNWENPNA